MSRFSPMEILNKYAYVIIYTTIMRINIIVIVCCSSLSLKILFPSRCMVRSSRKLYIFGWLLIYLSFGHIGKTVCKMKVFLNQLMCTVFYHRRVDVIFIIIRRLSSLMLLSDLILRGTLFIKSLCWVLHQSVLLWF